MSDDRAEQLDAYQQAEPPLHRPRECPTCTRTSRAIVDRRCLRCRFGRHLIATPPASQLDGE